MTKASPQPPYALPPFQPRKKLFIALLLILALWIAVLLWLFFTTVWPLRHSLTTTQPAPA